MELRFGHWLEEKHFGNIFLLRDLTIRLNAAEMYPGGREVIYHRDIFGLRGRFGSPEQVTILTIGGSTTDQRWVPDQDTFQEVLAAHLAASGPPLGVANGGLDGHSTVGHLHSFLYWFNQIPNLHPAWVIACIGLNDINVGTSTRAQFDDTLNIRQGTLGQRIKNHLKNNSAFWQMFNTIRGIFQANWVMEIGGHGGMSTPRPRVHWAPYPHPIPSFESLPDARPRIQAYGERVRELIRAIRGFGARAVIVTQKSDSFRYLQGRLHGQVSANGQVFLDQAFPLLMGLNDQALQVCREEGAVCLDLARELDLTGDDFYDSIHTTAQGSRKIGDYLFEKLGPLLIAASPQGRP
ncbi:MAG: SGNH/GDSL hydrolase family protein [Magnetococcales bacterium]|nr:SGNH/GDSL hydrolase family protein [Magnetococcales bacterium]